MCNPKSAVDDASSRPDTDCTGTSPCPEELRVRITPKQTSYVVVLDATGNVTTSYPILEFDITDGPPGYAIDVQISRDAPGLLTGGPGLANAWDSTKPPADRILQQAFSSYTNGDRGLVLDGSGRATYTMPLEWWRDQARRPRSAFGTAKIYHRVLASPSAGAAPTVWSTRDGDTAPNVPINSNLVNVEVIDNGYIDGGTRKSVDMQFTVQETNTTDMYTIVQWKRGRRELWPQSTPGTSRYLTVRDYNLRHRSNYPNWTIDRLGTNPRYHDGIFDISSDGKTATTQDAPNSGSLGTGDTHLFMTLDFDMRVHLNFEVPAALTITRQEGSPPIYDLLEAVISPPEPFIIDSVYWDARVLLVRTASTVTVTHPNTFTGP